MASRMVHARPLKGGRGNLIVLATLLSVQNFGLTVFLLLPTETN